MIAFTMLKAKIASTPILKHFDPDQPPVIVVYASKGAVSAALIQEHGGIYFPVTFASRTLKPNWVNYDMVEKEVLRLLHDASLARYQSIDLALGRWHGSHNPLVLMGG